MFKLIGFDPDYTRLYETEQEALDEVKNLYFDDYVGVVELKGIYKVNREIVETTIEEAKESFRKMQEKLNGTVSSES